MSTQSKPAKLGHFLYRRLADGTKSALRWWRIAAIVVVNVGLLSLYLWANVLNAPLPLLAFTGAGVLWRVWKGLVRNDVYSKEDIATFLGLAITSLTIVLVGFASAYRAFGLVDTGSKGAPVHDALT